MLCILAAIPAAGLALSSFFLFDAPGSTESPLTVALFVCALASPVCCALGAGLPWLFRNKPFGRWLFFIPIVNFAALGGIVAAISLFCGGMLACK